MSCTKYLRHIKATKAVADASRMRLQIRPRAPRRGAPARASRPLPVEPLEPGALGVEGAHIAFGQNSVLSAANP